MKKLDQKMIKSGYLLRFPLGIYTLPDGVLTKHDGSKSTSKSLLGLPVTRPFIRFIVGFRGGTSGGADGTPSRRQPANTKKKAILYETLC